MADDESDTYGNIDTPMSASVARLHPSDPHSLWDQKQFVWFVVLAALGLILVLIETVRQISLIDFVGKVLHFMFVQGGCRDSERREREK